MDRGFPHDDHEFNAENEEGENDDTFLLLFRFGTEWTDWGTLQHEAALGCTVGWQEWLVAFSATWESPFLVFDCGRAGEFVGGVLGVEELWDGLGGWDGDGEMGSFGCWLESDVGERPGWDGSVDENPNYSTSSGIWEVTHASKKSESSLGCHTQRITGSCPEHDKSSISTAWGQSCYSSKGRVRCLWTMVCMAFIVFWAWIVEGT